MQSLMQISPSRKNTDTFFTLPLPSLLHTQDSLGLGFAQEVHYITTVYLRFIEIYYGCRRIFKGRHRPASRPNKFSELTKKKKNSNVNQSTFSATPTQQNVVFFVLGFVLSFTLTFLTFQSLINYVLLPSFFRTKLIQFPAQHPQTTLLKLDITSWLFVSQYELT